MKNLLIVTGLMVSGLAYGHSPLSLTTINAMNMMNSENVRNCIAALNSRHPGDFNIQRATFHNAGTNSEYHLFGGFLEGADMMHGNAHVDVKVGLLPPLGPGYQCRVISERD